MASNVKETVRVDSLGKWGPKVGNEFYGWSKKIDEAQKGKIVPGGEYLVDVYVSDSGKKYINSVLSSVESEPKQTKLPSVKEIESAPVTSMAKIALHNAKSETMSKADWSAKDRSQLIGGLSHDAAQLASGIVTMGGTTLLVPEILDIYKELLEGMLKIREELK